MIRKTDNRAAAWPSRSVQMVYINERWRGRDVVGGGYLLVWCTNSAFAQRHSGKPLDSRLLSAHLQSGPPAIDAKVPRARLRCSVPYKGRRTRGDERKNLTSVQANNRSSQYNEDAKDWSWLYFRRKQEAFLFSRICRPALGPRRYQGLFPWGQSGPLHLGPTSRKSGVITEVLHSDLVCTATSLPCAMNDCTELRNTVWQEVTLPPLT
jgi:hypothetical protein